jgi:hypothetical protein
VGKDDIKEHFLVHKALHDRRRLLAGDVVSLLLGGQVEVRVLEGEGRELAGLRLELANAVAAEK